MTTMQLVAILGVVALVLAGVALIRGAWDVRNSTSGSFTVWAVFVLAIAVIVWALGFGTK